MFPGVVKILSVSRNPSLQSHYPTPYFSALSTQKGTPAVQECLVYVVMIGPSLPRAGAWEVVVCTVWHGGAAGVKGEVGEPRGKYFSPHAIFYLTCLARHANLQTMKTIKAKSQRELAAKLGVTEQYLSQLKRGIISTPSLERAELLAPKLGAKVVDFMKDAPRFIARALEGKK